MFSSKGNRGRSEGGAFGDNVEELDDSVGAIMAQLKNHGFEDNTLIFFTSDNGPNQEQGWGASGRANIYWKNGTLKGRMKGGKGQVWEGGIRMPGAVIWPGKVTPGSVSETLVSTMDIFPTILSAAGVHLPSSYVVDGKDMTPVLTGETQKTQHEVFFHYCGFKILAARIFGRFKVYWGTQNWYTYDSMNTSICVNCCNGRRNNTGDVPFTTLCDCSDSRITWHSASNPPVYDIVNDPIEEQILDASNWPSKTGTTYLEVVRLANSAKEAQVKELHPKPNPQGFGSCTAGTYDKCRQPCCPGCKQTVTFVGNCVSASGHECFCDSTAKILS